ncbi:DUF5957 family protein [Staphylospora marina]|uniref:DUF5957 family protein n=1 Tax=Staphylospora marina TaxID=2490858 RepID=UPI000F5C0523|nr:DUF5957 family protein [Staphylospora marina]
MKKALLTILAFIIGSIVGLVLSEWIGMLGFLLWGKFIGIRFLALLTGVLCALLVYRRTGNREHEAAT